MKNLRINLLLIVALLVTAATVSAFSFINREAPVAKPRLTYTWTFEGSSGQILTASQWEQRSPTGSECGEIGDLPCSIVVEAVDETALAAYFSGKSEQDILDMNPARKP